jgi:hypothetical protein
MPIAHLLQTMKWPIYAWLNMIGNESTTGNAVEWGKILLEKPKGQPIRYLAALNERKADKLL